MESGNYLRAVQSFDRARVKLGDRTDHPPLIVSLVYPLTLRSAVNLIMIF